MSAESMIDLWPDEDPFEPLAELPPDVDQGRPCDRPVATVVRPCVVLSADEPLTVAWHRIRRSGVQAGVVVDTNAHCVGLLSLREVSAAWPSTPPFDDEPTAGQAVRGARTTRINAATPLRSAARTLLSEDLGAAPVLGRDGRVVGLVTALDLLAGLTGHESVRVERTAVPPTRRP